MSTSDPGIQEVKPKPKRGRKPKRETIAVKCSGDCGAVMMIAKAKGGDPIEAWCPACRAERVHQEAKRCFEANVPMPAWAAKDET